MDRGVNDAICSSLFLASETKQTAKRICAPPFATLTSALSAPATAGTSAILLLLLSPGVVRALRGRRPLQTAAVAVSAGRRRRRSSAGAACGIARLRRGRGPHRPDGRSRELGASGCGAREHGARGQTRRRRSGDACRRRGRELEHRGRVARRVFFVLEVWSRAADTVTFFPLQQRRRERPPCAFPFLALQLIFFSRARTLDTAALVVVRQGIKTDKNNNKNETGKSPLLCVAVDSPLSISLPSFKAKK